MKRYFKYTEDSGYGPGKEIISYTEWEDEWNTRQAEWDVDRWRCSLNDDYLGVAMSLSDQPLSSIPPGVHEEISQEEFEQAWNAAVQYRQQHPGEQPTE
jgi:hypothetical protein